MLRARIALEDCRLALRHLEHAEDDPHFRLYWLACCTLLRTVGHVLQKVDLPKANTPQAEAIRNHWASLNANRAAHPIFWQFIERERNDMVKEYATNYDRGEHMMIVPDIERQEWVSEVVGPELYAPVSTGHFAGEDTRDVLRQAINWWDSQLARIEDS